MEQRRVSGKSHWYHETQSTTCPADVLPLVPEAAHVEDRFLLGLVLPEPLLTSCDAWIAPARELAALFFPHHVALTRLLTFSAYDRLSTALTVAQVYGVQRLCNHYAARLAPLPGPDSSRESNHRLAQITQYARQLASSPSVITSQAVRQLENVGLTTHDIVLITQIIGYVGFQARVIATFQALLAQPVRWLPGMPVQDDAPATHFATPNAQWRLILQGIELHHTCAEQTDVLEKWRTLLPLEGLLPLLVYDYRTLDATARLITHLPPAPFSGLATLIGARINGSAHCFNAAIDADDDLAEIRTQALDALRSWEHSHPAGNAVIQAVQLLTRAPDHFSAAHFTPLIEHGLSVEQAVNLLAGSGLCGWLNRLRIALGEMA